ncbi:uncharacterized protein PAC_13478 [Phialocephala subalpina]|uniref:Rieske domain-containing protein n=1 Tax=Phialocephala subalpina TaxID=576137 RepID=A0A1L7XEX9_9HELO|nr:uncharacterized protein PAC_13478 [Phialocephala subalpina]
MALPGIAVYALGLGIILSIICLVPSFRLEKVWSKASPSALPWLEESKEEVDLSSTSQKVVASKFSTSWWTDDKLYQLECRAIFSKQWLFVTHVSRFQKPGDYRTFEVAGYSFLVILGKDKQLRAFHNVCRHRAYAVTKKECGRSTVLGCRYHGWSYDTKGKLIKAPEFDNVPGFDKKLNSLWEVALEVRQSLLFVNLDAGKPTQDLDLGVIESLLSSWRVPEMRCISDWKFEAAFNWKLIGLPGSELYVTVLTASGALKNEHQMMRAPFWTEMLPSWIGQQQQDAQMLHTTLVRRLASGRVLTIKAIPKSAKVSMVECSVFSKYPKNPKQLEELKTRIYHDIERLESIQRRIEVGQEPLSSLEPILAKQDEIDAFVKEHVEAERLAGSQIEPAARLQNFTSEGKADDDFCRELENPASICGANAKGLLDW